MDITVENQAPTLPRQQQFRTLDLKPEHGEMIKPAEAVDIVGTEGLTLQDRRIWNSLLANAHSPKLGQRERNFRIPLSELRDNHSSNDRVKESVERLMKTIVRYRDGNTVRRFQLLGGNDLEDSDRDQGFFTYSFDDRLVELLENSTMFAKLKLEVVAAFSSKYALALYEHVARRVRMKHKFMQEYTVEEFREILGVPDGKLSAFGSLKQRAIDPAIEEINAFAEFSVYMAAKRTGKKITHVNMSWVWKDSAGRAEAEAELLRPRAGRKARIRRTTEGIIEAVPVDMPEMTEEQKASMRRDLFSGSDGYVKP